VTGQADALRGVRGRILSGFPRSYMPLRANGATAD